MLKSLFENVNPNQLTFAEFERKIQELDSEESKKELYKALKFIEMHCDAIHQKIVANIRDQHGNKPNPDGKISLEEMLKETNSGTKLYLRAYWKENGKKKGTVISKFLADEIDLSK